MQSFDVIVVGAGAAGAAAALFLREAGRSVALIDKRDVGETGARWVNSVPAWCFEEAGLPVPHGELLFRDHGTHGIHLVAPDGRGRVSIAAPAVLHVDMRRLTEDLVRRAEQAGVVLRQGTLRELSIEQGEVRGLVLDGGEKLRARLVVDATGLGAHVRRRVPALARACPEVDAEHRCVAAQHQFEVKDRHGLAAFLEQRGARPGDDVAFPGIAGGYSTLTLFTRRDDDVIGVLAGSIPALGVDGGAELVRRFVASQPWIGARMWGGQGAIPLRRPYATLGAARVALLGDSACQVYSSHGSGIGIGLVAARLLASAASSIDDPGSPRVLDRYARRFRQRHGGLLAASDAFRRYAQGLRPEVLSALIGHGLLDASLAEAAITQRPTRPDLPWALATAQRAAAAPGTALAFAPVALKNVLLDRLGRLGGVPRVGGLLDRALDPLIGRGARRAPDADWSLPE